MNTIKASMIILGCLPWFWQAAVPCLAVDQIVIRFVESPRTSAHVVLLGDLVEVLAGRSQAMEEMLSIPLGPAPRENKVQSWHRDDVLQHIELRGIHPSSIRWSGATQTQLQRISQASGTGVNSIQPAFIQARTIQQAENLVAQAIREYLNLKTGEQVDWVIKASVPPKLADTIRIRRNIIGIGGGQEPWHGAQQFVLQVKERDQITNVTIAATVELPPVVVVAKRPLRRDEIITADLLEYAPLQQRDAHNQSMYFADMEQLIGQQIKRSISTGLPISSDYVGTPTVIQRNEMIEVESVSGQVAVRTMARSLGSGAVGDLIDIELISSKKKLLAAVVGPMKVRVAAVAARGGIER